MQKAIKFILFFFTFWLNTLFSQNVFEKSLKNYYRNFVLTPDSGFAMFSTEFGSYSVGGSIIKINKMGVVVDSIYNAKLKTESAYFILNAEDGYMIVGETHDDLIDDGFGDDFIVEKVDFDGNILWELPLKGVSLIGAINTLDGNIIIAGTILEQPELLTNPVDIVIYKINENAEIVWSTIFGKQYKGIFDGSYQERGDFIMELDNNYYLSYNYYTKKFDAKLAKISNEGELLWVLEDTFNSNATYRAITSVFMLDNKKYFTNINNSIFEFNDKNGVYHFTKEKIQNSNSGFYWKNFENSCNELTVIEKKGESYYFNKYKNIDALYSTVESFIPIYDIKKTLDGGFAYLGQYDKFIKTDCFGNKDVWDDRCTNRLKSNNSVVLYPNPTNGYLNIETNFKIKRIKIIDFLGKEIEFNNYCNCNKQTIDISHYSQGNYFIKIEGINSVEIRNVVKF